MPFLRLHDFPLQFHPWEWLELPFLPLRDLPLLFVKPNGIKIFLVWLDCWIVVQIVLVLKRGGVIVVCIQQCSCRYRLI